MIELQRTTANLAIRLEELNNSLVVLQEAVETNREDMDKLRQEFQRPQVIFGGPQSSAPGGFVDPGRTRGLAAVGSLGTADITDDSAGQAQAENRSSQPEAVRPQVDPLPSGPYHETMGPPTSLNIASGGERNLKQYPEADAAFADAAKLYEAEDYGLAIFEINSLIRQHPDSDKVPASQHMLGECYFKLKDWSQAVIEYGKVLSSGFDSKIEDSLYKIGLCYEYLGNSGRARSAYDRLLERYPNSEQARMARSRLEGLP